MLSELSLLGTDTETGGRIIDFIVISGSNAEKLSRLASLGIENETFATGLDELTKVTTLITDVFGVPEDYLSIDLSIARGLDYYTGTVYETLLDEHPSIGSVCSGGRYDNLTGFYSNGSYPGIGASIGLSRLFYQLREADIVRPESSTLIKALILPWVRKRLIFRGARKRFARQRHNHRCQRRQRRCQAEDEVRQQTRCSVCAHNRRRRNAERKNIRQEHDGRNAKSAYKRRTDGNIKTINI